MGRKVLGIQLPGKKRGIQQRRHFEVVKEDMQEVGAREDEVLTDVHEESADGRS